MVFVLKLRAQNSGCDLYMQYRPVPEYRLVLQIIAGGLMIMTCYCSCSLRTWRFQGVEKQLLFLRNELVRRVRSGGVVNESALSSL